MLGKIAGVEPYQSKSKKGPFLFHLAAFTEIRYNENDIQRPLFTNPWRFYHGNHRPTY
jgi:hypothetical protein